MIEVGPEEAKGESSLYSRSLSYRFWFMSECESPPRLFGLRTRMRTYLPNIIIILFGHNFIPFEVEPVHIVEFWFLIGREEANPGVLSWVDGGCD